jgi:uncharacterized protein (DUF433 family)
MVVTETCYEHITVDEHGVAYIAGTTMKVIELVREKLAFGWSPEEFLFQHPYLTLGQIHAALAYYWDHAEEIDRDMTERQYKAKELQKHSPVSPLVTRLRAKGFI